MKDPARTNQKLIEENAFLKQRIRELEKAESERMRMEQAYKDSELKYRSFIEYSSDVVFCVDQNGEYKFVNQVFASTFGQTPDYFLGKTFWDIYPKEHADHRQAASSKVFATGESQSVEVVVPLQGRTLYFIAKANPVRDETGKVVLNLTHATDITDRKWAEDALRESEGMYRILFEGINDAVFVHDLDEEGQSGQFLQVNDVACLRLGYTREELLSLTPRDITMPEEYERIADKRIDLASQGDILAETIHVTKDGRKIPVESNIRKFQYLGKQVALSISRDITDRKRAEAEREKLQAVLTQVRKMESIGALAGGIAHDFNNLLTGIQGNASLIMIDLDPSHPHYERLRHVEECIASGAELTSQLLGFARGGRYDVMPVSMNDIVEKSSVMFGRTKKEISIHRKYAKTPCIVEMDRSQIEQVFMNLFVNAGQAMPEGGDISIETEEIVLDQTQIIYENVKPGQYVKITVTDTGTGMDKETRDRIFDPFFTTKGMSRGTGLGLATVYGIIKGHKGMITVDSEPGQGTTFTLYLPASKKDPAEKEKTAEAALHGTETVLLVDDEPMVLGVNREMLESLGYRIYAVGSGQEAVAVYTEKKHEIDLVVLDMVMPGISGGETFDLLREISPEVKVLLSSGYSIEGRAREILDRGCNGFLQKPFRLKELSRSVREMLD